MKTFQVEATITASRVSGFVEAKNQKEAEEISLKSLNPQFYSKVDLVNIPDIKWENEQVAEGYLIESIEKEAEEISLRGRLNYE